MNPPEAGPESPQTQSAFQKRLQQFQTFVIRVFKNPDTRLYGLLFVVLLVAFLLPYRSRSYGDVSGSHTYNGIRVEVSNDQPLNGFGHSYLILSDQSSVALPHALLTLLVAYILVLTLLEKEGRLKIRFRMSVLLATMLAFVFATMLFFSSEVSFYTKKEVLSIGPGTIVALMALVIVLKLRMAHRKAHKMQLQANETPPPS